MQQWLHLQKTKVKDRAIIKLRGREQERRVAARTTAGRASLRRVEGDTVSRQPEVHPHRRQQMCQGHSSVRQQPTKQRKIAEVSLVIRVFVEESKAHEVPTPLLLKWKKDTDSILEVVAATITEKSKKLATTSKLHVPITTSGWVTERVDSNLQ